MDAKAPATDIVIATSQDATTVLMNTEKYEAFVALVKAKIAEQKPDVSTDKGRKTIGAFARTIASSKVALDDAGAALVKDISFRRNKVKAELQELQDQARKPLTDWEEADTKRVAALTDIISKVRLAGLVRVGSKAEQVQQAILWLNSLVIKEETFLELFTEAEVARKTSLEQLQTALEQIQLNEQQAAELARLKAAEAARPKTEPKVIEGEAKALAKEAGEAKNEKAAERLVSEQQAAASVERSDEGKRPEKVDPAPASIDRRTLFRDASAAIAKASGITQDQAVAVVLAIVGGRVPHIKAEI